MGDLYYMMLFPVPFQARNDSVLSAAGEAFQQPKEDTP